eukprot:scaffold48_cov311-Pinguiococcus_pyrenoidosus.AAC.228
MMARAASLERSLEEEQLANRETSSQVATLQTALRKVRECPQSVEAGLWRLRFADADPPISAAGPKDGQRAQGPGAPRAERPAEDGGDGRAGAHGSSTMRSCGADWGFLRLGCRDARTACSTPGVPGPRDGAPAFPIVPPKKALTTPYDGCAALSARRKAKGRAKFSGECWQ